MYTSKLEYINNYRCGNQSKYIVNGRNYCNEHYQLIIDKSEQEGQIVMSEPEPIGDLVGKKFDSTADNQRPCHFVDCTGIIEKGNYKCNTCGKTPRGGWRPNSGWPKGKKKKKTLEAMRVKAAFVQRILKNANKLLNAQMSLAVGEQVLMVAITEGKTKRYEIVTDHNVIKQYLDWNEGIGDNKNPGDENNYYYLTTKPANNQALDSLINRALGKVPEKLEVDGGFFKQPELIIKVIGDNEQDEPTSDGGESSETANDDQSQPETTLSPTTPS